MFNRLLTIVPTRFWNRCLCTHLCSSSVERLCRGCSGCSCGCRRGCILFFCYSSRKHLIECDMIIITLSIDYDDMIAPSTTLSMQWRFSAFVFCNQRTKLSVVAICCLSLIHNYSAHEIWGRLVKVLNFLEKFWQISTMRWFTCTYEIYNYPLFRHITAESLLSLTTSFHNVLRESAVA